MLRYLQRLFPVTSLTKLEQAQSLANDLTREVARKEEERQRLLAEVAEERAAHIKEIKQLANHISIQYSGIPVFPDIALPKVPEPAPGMPELLAKEMQQRREERKRRDPLAGMQILPGKGHPIAAQTLAEEEKQQQTAEVASA